MRSLSAGSPPTFVEIVQSYGEWMPTAPFPKLFVNAEPGAILTGDQREFCRGWANQTEVTVDGHPLHPGGQPDEIGEAIADWLPTR